MKFIKTELEGAYLIEPARLEDERGFFARTFCEREFAARCLETHFAQCNISFNLLKGTLRGLHFQAPPHEEAKIVRCTAGAAFDVIVDIRPGSPTFRRWLGVELSAQNRKMLYIPGGFAHGFQSIEGDTELFYQMSKAYVPEAARGLRWNDPVIGISWPMKPLVVSERDRSYPMLSVTP